MKAWHVDFGDDITFGIVLAETSGMARQVAIANDDSGEQPDSWTDLKVKRAPAFDGDAITERMLILAGTMWADCNACGTLVQGNTDRPAPVFADGHVFCNPACRDELQAKPGYLPAGRYTSVDSPRLGIVLYREY